MSLINQVLNDLEKRGVTPPDAAQSVRAVPARPRWMRTVALAAVLALVGAGAGVWWGMSSGALASDPPKVALAAPRQAPVVAQSAPVAAASQPQSAVAASGAAGVQVAEAPASQLSMELAALPASAVSAHASEDVPVNRAEPKHKAPAHSARAGTRAERGPIKQISPAQRADAEYEQAVMLIQDRRANEAQPHLETALRLNPDNAQARQTLAGVLVGNRRNAEAERVLRDGLRRDPKAVALAMLLARLQVERSALTEAQDTLDRVQPYASEQADYQAFLAAVLQRESRHEEAVTHYRIALRQAPGSGVWLMGLGISLQALNRSAEARDAYRSALDSRSLSAELQRFVEQRLKQL